MEALERLYDGVSKDLEHVKPIRDVAEYLRVKPGQIVLGGFALVFLLVLSGILSEFITSIFGFLYPAYMSCKALEHADEDPKTRMQWLTYWVVFSSLMLLDMIAGPILHLIPFYYVLKLLLLMWLFYPKSNGATIIYEKIIKPFWKKHESLIDKTLAEGEAMVDIDAIRKLH